MKDIANKPVRIIVFAKAPQPGLAKTRLIPALGAEGAARLAKRMLQHTLREALLANVGTVELCAAPAVSEPAWQGVELPPGIVTSTQGEGDLGARMARAAQHACDTGEVVILIGTDCPQLDAPRLRAARDALAQHDAVIHCTTDGGYALLGFRRFSATLFERMPWSTSDVATMTLHRMGQQSWRVAVLDLLRDVDTPEDLKYLDANWRVNEFA